MSRILSRACAGVWFALAGFSAFFFYDRYWLWLGCFNDLGRCYDPVSKHVFVEGAGFIWSSLTLLCLILAVVSWR
jgi:hypothetical protein